MVQADQLPIAVSAEALLGTDDGAPVLIEVPEWGFSLTVKPLTRGQVRKMGEGMSPDEAEAFALSSAAVDPVITIDQATELLDGKSFASTERVLSKILEISGMTPGFRSG